MKRIWPRCPLLAIWAVGALALYADLASAAPDVSISRADDGTTAAGQRVSQYTLANQRGVTLKVITYGAIVTALDVPDRTGHVADIVLGFDSLHDYEAHNGSIHFGALIGRYANRIAGGRFSARWPDVDAAGQRRAEHAAWRPRQFDAKVWTVTGTHRRERFERHAALRGPTARTAFPAR